MVKANPRTTSPTSLHHKHGSRLLNTYRQCHSNPTCAALVMTLASLFILPWPSHCSTTSNSPSSYLNGPAQPLRPQETQSRSTLPYTGPPPRLLHLDFPRKQRDRDQELQPPSETGSASPAGPDRRSVCNTGPRLQDYGQNIPTASICAAYFYVFPNETVYTTCTAWFVRSTLVMTAGHCVAGQGTGRYTAAWGQRNPRYGVVCCYNQPTTSIQTCPQGYGFDIVEIIATNGWLNLGYLGNDGAILRVIPPATGSAMPIVPLSYQRKPGAFCSNAPSYYVGFPLSTGGGILGCNVAFQRRMFYSYDLGLLTCQTNVTADPSFTVRGGACGGMSGGPWLSFSDNVVWGILVSGSASCDTSQDPPEPLTNMVGLSDACSVDGVCVSCLINKMQFQPSSPTELPCNATVPNMW
jgi:Trypsin-like peptidase domain